jgi:hypothetical protein
MAEQEPNTMDDNILGLLRDRFSKVDRDNAEMLVCLKDHIKKDEEYWKKIDDQHAQIRLVKYLGGSGLGAAVLHWLYNTFKH